MKNPTTNAHIPCRIATTAEQAAPYVLLPLITDGAFNRTGTRKLERILDAATMKVQPEFSNAVEIWVGEREVSDSGRAFHRSFLVAK